MSFSQKVKKITAIFLGLVGFMLYLTNQYAFQTSVYQILNARKVIHQRDVVKISKNESKSMNSQQRQTLGVTYNLETQIDYRQPVYIIWTRWRCGSSFLGRLLSTASPNTFYRLVLFRIIVFTLITQPIVSKEMTDIFNVVARTASRK